MLAFVVGVAVVTSLTGTTSRVGHFLRAGGVPADVFIGLAVCWIPLMVIDTRRCTREMLLRSRVEADLMREATATRARAQELAEIRAAAEGVLAAGGPRIVYQPIVEMSSGVVVGYEALSRFDDGIAPDVWFERAARVGMGADLELAAVQTALAGLAMLPVGAYLSINAGPALLCDPRLREVLASTSPDRIVLELTEHIAVDDYRDYRDAIGGLRRLGLRLAVDDAGAGYSSFRHVVDLTPDIIKIDGSLVHGAHLDPSRRSLIIALVSFAADLGATLIAECVEVEAEAEALRGWGIQIAQGWHFGRPAPMPAGEQPAGVVAGEGDLHRVPLSPRVSSARPDPRASRP